MRGENGMVSANSRTQREEEKTYKYPRKAPELAWDLDVCAIAIKRKCSGWPFKRQGGDAMRLRKKTNSNTKNQPWDQTQPWECLQNPRHSHTTLFDFLFFSPVLVFVVPRHPSLTSNVSQRGLFSPTPMHGHCRYVNYLAFMGF